ncbi:MAG: DNA polymerase/3'-5' exonuclease PolX [Planctomycetes bacterium]|nr:DNA polymerase/3'-5' exonuclease PolX [Planctomycetota bacterium]
MENLEVAQIFDEVADLLELQGENPFRIRAYRNAARTVNDLGETVSHLVQECPEKLTELPGIGKDLAGKITTIVETGDLPLRQELCKQTPAGLRQLMLIPGCGPKRVQLLNRQLGIRSVADLRRAARRHAIRTIKGFGPKTEANILKAIGGLERTSQRLYLADTKSYAEAVLHHLQAVPGVKQAVVAGSYRRCKETVGDLDVLVSCEDVDDVMDRFVQFEGVQEVLAHGKRKSSIRLRSGLQIDLRAVAEESFGAALQYFTGSKQHNILVRRLGQERGLKINEYGVFENGRRVGGRTEEEVYTAVGLPWIPPELREARHEIEWARAGCLPMLIERDAVRADLHMHTTATDGRSTIEDMILAAKKRGYSYIAITDHSKRVTMAKGLDADRLRQHWRAIDKVAQRVSGITVLKGVELDILEDGSLDLPDDVLQEADWVVASIHYGQKQPSAQLTRRVVQAIRSPYVHAIGHPTGRLIGKRSAYPLDLEEVFKAAADYGCWMELNCQPSRLDLDDVNLAAAKEHGIPIVLGTDAHSTEELRFMEFGVNQARRAGLEAKDVANTRTLTQFRRLSKR